MNASNPQKSSLKEKAAHEFKEIAVVFLYLAFSFARSRPTACSCSAASIFRTSPTGPH
jgi:hypothetical protein